MRFIDDRDGAPVEVCRLSVHKRRRRSRGRCAETVRGSRLVGPDVPDGDSRDKSGAPVSRVGTAVFLDGGERCRRKPKRVRGVGSGRYVGSAKRGAGPGPGADRGGCIITSPAEISRRSGNAMMRRLVGPLRK